MPASWGTVQLKFDQPVRQTMSLWRVTSIDRDKQPAMYVTRHREPESDNLSPLHRLFVKFDEKHKRCQRSKKTLILEI